MKYSAYEVDMATYDAHPLGSSFKGGVVVEGTCDEDTNELLLVVRDTPLPAYDDSPSIKAIENSILTPLINTINGNTP